MASEFEDIPTLSEEEKKLFKFYKDIITNEYQPTTQAQIAFFMQLLNKKIVQVDRKETFKKRIHYFLRISILFLSGSSTVLLGLQKWKFDFSADIVLILTATITFFSALATFWDIESYWVRLKVMHNNLKALRYKYAFAVEGGDIKSNKENKVFLNEFLLIHSDGYWENYLSSLNKMKETQTHSDNPPSPGPNDGSAGSQASGSPTSP